MRIQSFQNNTESFDVDDNGDYGIIFISLYPQQDQTDRQKHQNLGVQNLRHHHHGHQLKKKIPCSQMNSPQTPGFD